MKPRNVSAAFASRALEKMSSGLAFHAAWAVILFMACSRDDPGLPAKCAGLKSPFLEADCLAALRDECRSFSSGEDCAGQEPFLFNEGAFAVHCGWAKVVEFSDAAACKIQTVKGRCEAGIEQTGLGCGGGCGGEATPHYSLRADSDEMELIEMPCTLTGSYLGGPLGPDSAVGAEPGEYGKACAEGTTPPAAPICACSSVACESK